MRKPTRGPLLTFLATTVLATILGCYPGAPDEIHQTDVVITVRDEGHDFSKDHTWAMADTVWPVMYGEYDGAPDALDSMILAEVTAAMTVKGYQRILDPSESNLPDVYITVATMSSLVGYWAVPPPPEAYCEWWDYCSTCCSGGSIPIFPDKYPAGVFAAGTLFIDMYDPGAIDKAEGTLPVVWAAVAHGVVEQNLIRARENTRSAIRRAFAQSPYLATQP